MTFGTADWHNQESAGGVAAFRLTGNAGGGGVGAGNGGQSATDLSDVNYSTRVPLLFAVGVSDTLWETNGWIFDYRATAGWSEASYFLPNGLPATPNIPALPDPLTISFDSTFVRGHLGVSRLFFQDSDLGRLRVGVRVGREHARVTTRLSSALLRTKTRTRHDTNFRQITAAFEMPVGQLTVVNEWTLSRYSDGTESLATTLRLDF